MSAPLRWRDQEISVQRRSTTKRIQLKISSEGHIKVSAPKRVSNLLITQFIAQHDAWISSKLQDIADKNVAFSDGDRIGSHHLLQAHYHAPRLRTAIKENQLHIFIPAEATLEDALVQAKIHLGANKVLRNEAKTYLPTIVANCAEKYGFHYNEIRFKQMKTRWGSCSSLQNINLNVHLMRLPSELIQLVVLHELVHTRYLSHSVDFWTTFIHIEPRAKELTKRLKQYSPHW